MTKTSVPGSAPAEAVGQAVPEEDPAVPKSGRKTRSSSTGTRCASTRLGEPEAGDEADDDARAGRP